MSWEDDNALDVPEELQGETIKGGRTMSTKFGSKKELKDVTVTVKAVSKTGSVLGQDAVWYSPSKYAKNLPTFERDKTYQLKIQENGDFKNIMEAILIQSEVKSKTEPSKPFSLPKVSKERDFDKEARGKSRCTLFAAALQCLSFHDHNKYQFIDEIISDATKLAEAGMAYTFDDKPVVSIPKDDGTAYDELEAATKIDVEDTDEGLDENPLDTL